jgi:hypothetical protein
MILMRANTFRGPLEGQGPENRDFLGPLNGSERSECHFGPNKLSKYEIGPLLYLSTVLLQLLSTVYVMFSYCHNLVIPKASILTLKKFFSFSTFSCQFCD